MFERFTDRARKVMALANQEAQRFNHEYIGTEHILLGLVKEGAGVGANVLKNFGLDLRGVRSEVEKLIKRGPQLVEPGKLPQTPRAKRVIEFAIAEARNLNHNYVGTEHMLLGLLREREGLAAQVLENLGVQFDRARAEVLNLIGGGREVAVVRSAPGAADGTPFDEFLKNDIAARFLQLFIAELGQKKDAAVHRANYEVAAEYRDLMERARGILDQLGSLLARQAKPPA